MYFNEAALSLERRMLLYVRKELSRSPVEGWNHIITETKRLFEDPRFKRDSRFILFDSVFYVKKQFSNFKFENGEREGVHLR